jgi:uncharacterized protein YkwD
MKRGYNYSLIVFIFCLSASFPVHGNFSKTPNKEAEPVSLTPLEREVVAELNLARTQPKVYAEFLAVYSTYFVGKELHEPGMTILLTKEGKGAVNEAIKFLKSQKSMAVLTPSKGMSKGAGDMVRMQEITSQTGHKGIDGSSFTERISRYGTWSGLCSENIDYGNNNARRIVMALIIDDGVSSRGHRKSIFEPSFRRVGVAFGSHRTYTYMCVIEYAVSYAEKR